MPPFAHDLQRQVQSLSERHFFRIFMLHPFPSLLLFPSYSYMLPSFLPYYFPAAVICPSSRHSYSPLPFPLCRHNESCAMYYVISASLRRLPPTRAQGSLCKHTCLFKKGCEIVYVGSRMMYQGRVMSNDICQTLKITAFCTKDTSRALFYVITVHSSCGCK
jgi:hypothetical protein